MFGKPILLAAVISIALGATAVAQQGSTPAKPPPPTHLGHVGQDVCKSHPNLPQCK